jgi:galactokinase
MLAISLMSAPIADAARAAIAAAGSDGSPLVLARAPGRVNLIGEHTDYNGLPVLPMAIDRAVWVAARPRHDGIVEAVNLDAAFAPRTFAWQSTIAPSASGDWANYLKAAVQCAARRRPAGGVSFTVASDLPAAAGLSSSSALVVATALAALAAHEVAVDPRALAEELAAAERYVGVLSGGMDQGVILLAEAGAALHLDFFPLRAQAIPIPAGGAVIVAESLVRAEKSAGARSSYNRRVVECRLACRLFSALRGTPIRRLGDLVAVGTAGTLAPHAAALASRVPDTALSLADIASAIAVPAAELEPLLADDDRRPLDLGTDRGFRPVARARHVLSEADRVAATVAALRAGDLERVGRLMTASHRSCRDDYEVSVPDVDELVAVLEEAGAFGARMTGAGFGGAVVALASPERVPEILAAADARFYHRRLAPADAARHRFVFSPAAGATVASVMPAATPSR